uniref:C2H2-type domain-containing protein n=1 Tax=Magallana gigas TaxID=29159 RepID=A0A8W8KSG6_MAGGI
MENDQSQSTENDDIGTISEISGSDKSQPNELVCSHCGFSAEDQEVMENHIRVEHPKVWAQILIDDTKILLALGKDPHKVQRSRPGAQVPKKEAPKEQKPKAVIRYITSAQGGKKKRRSDGPRSSGHYSCTVCQKRYKTICLLNAHMGLVHKDRRYAQIKRRKELLKYKQRLIALKKKNDQNKDGEDDTEERKKDEEVEEIKKEAEDVEEEETVSEMKAEAGEERTKHGEVTVTPYPCLTCNRFFVDFKTLELHMTQSGHMGEEMGSLDGEITVTKQKSVSKRGILLYVCSLCKREFVKEENCQSHCALKVCKKPWKKSCPIISCKKLFFENNMFFQHMYSEHKSEYPFVCSVEGCKRLFFHTAALNSHVSAHSAEKDGHFPPPRPIEDGRKRCGYCGMLFTYNENLRQHVKKIHDNEIFGKFKEMVEHNKAAEPLSTNKKFLQVQKDKEEDVDKIDTFKRMDKTQVTIRNHVSGEEFKCYTCDETFSHIDDVGDHMVDTGHCGLPLNALNGARDIRIRIRNTGEQCYVCTLCKMEFKKKETIDNTVQDATCKKKYKRLCPIMSCRILFRNFNYFKAHMSTMHKDEFPFKCQECGKEFEQTTALNSHRNSHYKDTQHIQTDVLNSDTPMTCHICKERFRNNRELREHKEKAHEIQRKYMCDICGKKYKRKENLKDHIFMAHERDPSKDFVSCPTCGKALSSRRSLRFHLRFAHTDAKPCVCEICGYSTKQLGNLAFHMRNTHSDVRPYECEWPGCTKTFKDRQLWQRHTQRHEIAAGNLEKAKTYGPIFTCKICQKGFCGKYNLDNTCVTGGGKSPLKPILKNWSISYTLMLQQKYHQILNASIEVPSTSASGSASEQKGRDYMSEAQSQVSLLEGGASIAENVIEEAVDESQIIIENVGDQYIIMNPDWKHFQSGTAWKGYYSCSEK